jgi:hypothetical protein
MATPTEQTLRPDQKRILGNAHHDAGCGPAIVRVVVPGLDDPYQLDREVGRLPPGCVVVLSGATWIPALFGRAVADIIDSSAAGAVVLAFSCDSGSGIVLWSRLPHYHPGQSFRIP